MGLKIIVTAGPTNERIDSVMKITNMSTGRTGSSIVEAMLREHVKPEHRGWLSKVYYLSPRLACKPKDFTDGGLVEYIEIESAEDLLKELKRLLTTEHIDAVVHSAAVGDYKAKYSVRGEDLAEEITKRILNAAYGKRDQMSSMEYVIRDIIMDVLDNPKCAADDSGKMSSYEPHLMTMMTLTPKVIGCIKETSPDTMLIGFKLLDGVTNEELFQVADKLREKNKADYIVANDLSRNHNGMHWAMIIGKDGIYKECWNNSEIAQTLVNLITTRYETEKKIINTDSL